MKMLLGLLFALVLVTRAAAAEPTVPSWMKWDAGTNTVELWIKAAYNGNNGSWNFNGYYDGGVNIVVPVGSTVLVHFESVSGDFPHSLVVTRPYPEGEIPEKAGREEVAIPRAYTRSPVGGCLSCEEDVRFKAKKAGQYYFFCGVASHGISGMWIRFEVSEQAAEPHIIVADDALGPDDQPAWQ